MLAPVTCPAWETRENGSFTLRLSPASAFGGMQEGSIYYVTLTTGIRKCWNRAEVEKVCRDYYEQSQAAFEDDEEETAFGIPSPDSLRRWHEGRVL